MALLAGFSGLAQVQSQAPPPPPAEAPPQNLSKEELDKLLGPIALYPDALIAVILPAATVPSDIVLAARFLSTNGDLAQIDNQPWDESVKSLARYPEIVKWMDQNLEWTTQLGEVFLDQPADVMNSIQSLRALAKAAGTLVDTPQQRVVAEESYIRVIPAEPDVIYVPQYDPEVVYVQPYTPYVEPVVSFGIGFAVGPWLNYDCDWPRQKVCVGDWNPRWRDDWRPGWRDEWRPEWREEWRGRGRRDGPDSVNVVNITPDSARVWQPSPRTERQHWQRQRNYQRDRENVHGRNRGGEWERHSRVVAKPSRPNFDRHRDNRDRGDWQVSDDRRSHRDRSDRVWQPGSSGPPASRNRDHDRGGREDWQRSDRDGSDRVRGSHSSRPEAWQNGQGGRRAEQGQRRREESQRASVGADRHGSSYVERHQVRRSSDSGDNRRGEDGHSIRSQRPNYEVARSERSSNRKHARLESRRSVARSEGHARPDARINRGPSGGDRPGSQRSHVASSRRDNDSRQARGGSPKQSSHREAAYYSQSRRSQQSAHVERSGGQSRRAAPAHSGQDRQQVTSAAGKGHRGGKGGGEKGKKDKGEHH